MEGEIGFTYPLTSLQAEQVTAIHAEANAKIDSDLKAIQSTCTEKCKSNPNTCPEHLKEVRKLWRGFYLNIQPGGWASYRSGDYVTEMKKLFDSRGGIVQIHKRAALESRMHARDALCTSRLNDTLATQRYKKEASKMFETKISEGEIRTFISKREREVASQRTAGERVYDARLAACESELQKREIYREDACDPKLSDTPAMTVLRLKWTPLFESGMPYQKIFATIQADISEHRNRQQILEEKLAELARGKAAYEKQGLAKKEKRFMKERSERLRMFEQYCFQCTTKDCQNLAVPFSLEEGLLECGICRQLYDDGVRKGRSYFCSRECMEEAGRTHVLSEHKCNAATSCTTDVQRSISEPFHGYCPDCWKHFGEISYFCTPKCWEKNYGEHLKRHVHLRKALAEELANNEEALLAWQAKVGITDEEMKRQFEGTALEERTS